MCVFPCARRYLRFSQPDAPRGFRVPGGKLGMWLCVLPQSIFAVGSVISAGWEVIAVGLGFQVLILVCFYARRALRARYPTVLPSTCDEDKVTTPLMTDFLSDAH